MPRTDRISGFAIRLVISATMAIAAAIMAKTATAAESVPDCQGTRGNVCSSEETCAAIPQTDFTVCVKKYIYWSW